MTHVQEVNDALPQVSVCVPTYRRPELLKRALASVAGQTYGGPLTCIISDNGGQSGVAATTAELAETSPAINWVVLQSPELFPPVENWRRAVDAADSEWVKILWDDDWLEPCFVERTISTVLATGAQAVTTAAKVVSPDGTARVLYEDTPALTGPDADEILRRYTGLLPALPVSPAAALLRREVILDEIDDARASGTCFDKAMGPDLGMILSSALGGSLAHVPEVLVNFWAGEDSITMTSDELRLRLCYDRTMLRVAAKHGVGLPRDVRRRLQHRSFLAWARREPEREGLLSPRPSPSRLGRNLWDRRSRLLGTR